MKFEQHSVLTGDCVHAKQARASFSTCFAMPAWPIISLKNE